ncbi:pleckstrin homology domain-containing family A member 6 isoform X3 [Kryptolebias marmoratus]|uniref:pleckstrin homology domain-containing family A member 6 isoform X3 n=1 Tax=Kryptolebias marmoratus TaxID=37003 RepID=UPI0007F89B82|nr:pleckstrin homology domain-containing family A member 6 isoform X3 [Kryptolebias marmoratus]
MEIKAGSRWPQLVRMDEQDRVSQASSVATISYFPVMEQGSDGKVQTFGKRCQAAKRDPNCPVVIRGWLNKKDSSGLKLWKRRWFVLSNYCLFYYKDSREESVLGSIPLPSYKILFCSPRECKNRKFTFKVVHQGMRSYFFSADTQEDMLGWVRALSQSATMEPDTAISRRCSSYQDFTQIGGSSESVEGPKSPSEEESPSQRQKHVSRTLSEPSQLVGGRMGRSHSEQRGRRSVHHRNRSPSNRTPSPADLSRRRPAGPNKKDDSLGGENATAEAEMMGMSSLSSRGQLGSRPHTPVGRVDIRPHDDPGMLPQTLYYAPASPKLEFKSAPTTPVTERWQSLNKPGSIYGSVHQPSNGRRPLGKSHSTGADLLPPLPPSSRAAHAPHPPQHHRHHHCSHLSVCVLPPAMASKSELRELPAIRPLESDADAVLTRLCGCDKLLQSLSVELTQLQMDKDSVHCALEMSRLQVEEWKNQGPRALEEALTQKVLLQEELVTIRARMCDVSLEMEHVWSQYERMESELSVIRSHLQHICNFGMPQEQSQAQRELWMMEDILAGLKLNRDNFCFLLGLQRHHLFQSSVPHPGSPGSPTERLHTGMDMEQEPPIRPPLPLELQENHLSRDLSHGWPEPPYEGIYCQAGDPVDSRGNNQPDLLNVKAQRDTAESQSGSKWIPPDPTNQSAKKMKSKMSEEEQIERMKRNQERMANKKKPSVFAQGPQSESSETRDEAPFPLRVTRVVTAVLPSSLVARKVSVEDPPPELDAPLPEQIPPETQQRPAEPSSKPTRRLVLESQDSSQSFAELHQEQPVKKTSRHQHQGKSRAFRMESQSEGSRAEASSNQVQEPAGSGGNESLDARAEEQSSAPPTPDMNPDLSLSPDQRDAKLRRVERIRERVMRSAVRESATTDNQHPVRARRKEVHQVPNDMAKKTRMKTGNESYLANMSSSAELQLSSATSQDHDEGNQHVSKSKRQVKLENRTQHSGKPGVANSKIKRPASPYHISSMTVYQKDGGKGFIDCNPDEQLKLEEHTADDTDNNFKSSDLRAQWFLSTNQWQGFMPLQIRASEPLSDNEKVDTNNQAHCFDDLTDPNEFSSAVSESLKKMKENHSLFYKIACDISISDSDITKNDEQTSRPEEEEELVISESEPASDVGTPSDQKRKDSNQHLPLDENSLMVNDKTLNPTHKLLNEVSVNPACDHEAITPEEPEDKSEQIVKVLNEAGDQKRNFDQTPDDCTNKHCLKKKLEDLKEDQERPEELKKYASIRKENNVNEQDQGIKLSSSRSNTTYEGGGVIRSASFGKPRVTVIRTSL